MALILPVEENAPKWGKNCFIAPNATIVGDVIMGEDCSVWFNTVIRGDVNSIRIGNKVNVQDGAVIHCTFKRSKTIIGNNVSIAHTAVVHGCTIEDNVLVGMGAIIMDDAIIGTGSVIAAGAIILPKTIVAPGSVYAGVPAKKVKDTGDEMKEVIQRTARNYPMYAEWFKESK